MGIFIVLLVIAIILIPIAHVCVNRGIQKKNNRIRQEEESRPKVRPIILPRKRGGTGLSRPDNFPQQSMRQNDQANANMVNQMMYLNMLKNSEPK